MTTDETVLHYGRCPVCDEASFPVHVLTPCGHDVEVTRHPFTAVGEVYSWTRTHSAAGATVLAMVDFLGGDIRVTAPVAHVNDIAIGDRLAVRSGGGYDFVLVPARDG